MSSAQRAQRALVSVLVSLAQAYGIALQVSRDSMAAEVLKAYRQVAKRAGGHRQLGSRRCPRDVCCQLVTMPAWVGQSALREAPANGCMRGPKCSRGGMAPGGLCVLGPRATKKEARRATHAFVPAQAAQVCSSWTEQVPSTGTDSLEWCPGTSQAFSVMP